jgi:exosortase
VNNRNIRTALKIREYLEGRNILFMLVSLSALFMVYKPMKTLYESSLQREYYSHIIIIPFITIYLVYQARKRIFSGTHYSFIVGIPSVLISALLYWGGQCIGAQFNQNDYVSIVALSAVLFINSAFILLYGVQAYKGAIFPLLFLVFVIPIPTVIMDAMIHFLQVGSTEFTDLLFMATSVPYVREGFVFHLSGQSIEVAKECSGIRSSMALFITCVLAGHLFLKTWWKKIVLLLFVVPITMFKNGIRITILTLLGTYVDPRIMSSSLHRDGGILFFILALLLTAPILFFLRRSEKTNPMKHT